MRADAGAVLERSGSIALVHLGRRGAPVELTSALHGELCAVAEEIDHDESIRAVVLASRGSSFCLGDGEDAPPAGSLADGVAAVAGLRAPVIALLHGEVLDAGLELALACDLRVATTSSRLGLTQVSRGSLPMHGGTQRLPRIIGRAHALRMLLLSERVGAAEAKALGLVHAVVAPAELARAGRRLAERVAARGPIAQRFAKEAIGAAFDLPLLEGLRLEGDLYVLLQSTSDREEGIASFRGKRPPTFTGR